MFRDFDISLVSSLKFVLEGKHGDIVFGFPWCMVRGVCSRYLVSATPPTVYGRCSRNFTSVLIMV